MFRRTRFRLIFFSFDASDPDLVNSLGFATRMEPELQYEFDSKGRSLVHKETRFKSIRLSLLSSSPRTSTNIESFIRMVNRVSPAMIIHAVGVQPLVIEVFESGKIQTHQLDDSCALCRWKLLDLLRGHGYDMSYCSLN